MKSSQRDASHASQTSQRDVLFDLLFVFEALLIKQVKVLKAILIVTNLTGKPRGRW